MLVYVARQPILNRNNKLYGYELLFRDGTSNLFPDVDGDAASSSVISNSYLTIGIDRISCGKMSFINFTEKLLLSKTPYVCPPEFTVIEVLEDIEVSNELIHSLKKLKHAGYTIALDDFVFSEKYIPLINLADIIKIDFAQSSRSDIMRCLDKLPLNNITLLAEKIETRNEYEFALDMGFQLFQGYFFCRPEIIKGKDIPVLKINLLRILAEVNKKEFSFKKVEELMSGDVSINYKILKYINSAYYKRLQKIKSIKHAIGLLGERNIRQFVSLFAISRMSENKPHELLKTSCIRAKFCENLSEISNVRVSSHELFSLGMFSLLDTILNIRMERVMEELPLTDELKSALIDQTGTLSDFLKLTIAYELADWNNTEVLAGKLDITMEKFPEMYMDACEWADSFSI